MFSRFSFIFTERTLLRSLHNARLARDRYVQLESTFVLSTNTMCENCFLKEYKTFSSWKGFERFQLELDKRKLEYVDSGIWLYSFDEYVCKVCNQVWWISEPELNSKGYCLKEEEAKRYLEKLEKDEKRSRIYYLIILAVIILVFIQQVIKSCT
jgi:hypothetical protein